MSNGCLTEMYMLFTLYHVVVIGGGDQTKAHPGRQESRSGPETQAQI